MWHFGITTLGCDYLQVTAANVRIAFATALIAGSVIGAGALGLAASAHASADNYAVIAYSLDNGVGGTAVNSDQNAARIAALENCQQRGGNHCTFYGVADNACIALAVNGLQEWYTATAPTSAVATRLALQGNPGSHIGITGCASHPVIAPPVGPAPGGVQSR